jgi:Animal haem peroxidase
MTGLAHGTVGRREQEFTTLLPLRHRTYDPQLLFQLSQAMKADTDTVKDGPDPEENVMMPAGYTYFGQFIDHDLTFDSTSSLDPSNSAPTNLRTPSFDLDCVYGDGPAGQPYLYDAAGEKLLYKNDPPDPNAKPGDPAPRDLARNPLGRAIIGDKRNDENSIVSQLQLGFIKYHNQVVDALKKIDPNLWNTPGDVFTSARNEVRWTYQRLVVDDFLPRIVRQEVLADLQGRSPDERADCYALYGPDKRGNLPREFVAAAYRFGHSAVRQGYRLNAGIDNRFSIFPGSDQNDPAPGANSLLGFDPITNNQVIDDWKRFFPTTPPSVVPDKLGDEPADDTKRPQVRLQYAYKIDPTIVDPLGVLPRAEVAGEGTAREAEDRVAPARLPDPSVKPPRPSLALLNLLRGNAYHIQNGQELARALRDAGLPAESLPPELLVTRQPVPGKDGMFKFVPIDARLQCDTPLWFYVLAEAQAPIVQALGKGEFDEKKLLSGPGARAQLGWVGGRIVAEVFYGLLDADPTSYVNAAPVGWEPRLAGDNSPIVLNLLKFADPGNA